MKKKWLCVLFIIVLGLFIRFYQFGAIPLGLNQDETAIGYNAFSILKTGRDEHGVFMPLYFQSFNDFKLPVYIYMVAISEMIFGVTAFAVRFPSALFGCLSILGLYYLVQTVTKSKKLSLVTALFLLFNPWSIFFSRVGLEVNVAVSLTIFGALFFVLAVKKNNSFPLYFSSILSFGVALYTYNITRIHATLLIVGLVYLHRQKIFVLKKKMLLIYALLLILIEIPFITTLFSHSGLGFQQNVLIVGGETRASMVEFRSYLSSLPHILTAIFFNTGNLVLWQYLKNLIASFSPVFFFVSAGNLTGDIGVGNMGEFYVIDALFILVGIIAAVVKKDKSMSLFFWWGLSLVLLVSLSAVVPHGTRSYALVVPLVVLSAYGCLEVIGYIQKQRTMWKNISLFVLALFLLYGVLYFQVSYYYRFPIVYANNWRSEDKALSLYLQTREGSYDHIIIDKNINFIYTSLVFYQAYTPSQFQRDVLYEKPQLFTNVEQIGKYQFRKINWDQDVRMKRTLFVTEPDNLPPGNVHEQVFSYPVRPVVLSVENKIIQYPAADSAFVVLSTD